MELTYTVRGADGKEYGPVNLDQLGGWIRERRLIPQQEVRRSDMQHWAPAGTFAELGSLFTAAAPAASDQATTAGVPTTIAAPAALAMRQIRSAGSWFYWIAGLSLVNSISAASGSDWRFIVGLGVTQLFEGAPVLGLVLAVIVAAFFVVLGVFACKGHLWAFIVGMVLFALDGLIFLIGQSWVGVGFHVLVLFFLFRGVAATRSLKAT